MRVEFKGRLDNLSSGVFREVNIKRCPSLPSGQSFFPCSIWRTNGLAACGSSSKQH